MRLNPRFIFGSSVLFALAAGCSGDPGGGAEGGGDASSSSTATPTTTTDTPEPSTGGVATEAMTSGSSSGTPPVDSTDDGEDETGPPIFLDLGTIPDMPPPVCSRGGGGDGGGGGGGGGDLALSYIWIANSSQGTISKIDTATMIEEGRYQARPSGGDPSRTSVNLAGDVAVANRNGGVAKFWADEEDCQDTNGIPGIQTSSGGADILPWEEDDCLAWYTPFVCGSNRPVAWTRGEFNEVTCEYEDMNLWTVCDGQVMLLDGDTGAVEETVLVPGSAFVYGGAADADGNFWGLNTSAGQLFIVENGSLDYEAWPLPPSGGYGITVDSLGRPWVCGGGSVARFDLDTNLWDTAGAGGGIGGCMTDGADLIWHDSGSGTLLGFDIETLAIQEQIPLPEYVHGVSVDFQGMVWGVSFAGSNAYRANPATGAVDTFTGLFGAYTYSDMTGFALSTAGGGGMPPM